MNANANNDGLPLLDITPRSDKMPRNSSILYSVSAPQSGADPAHYRGVLRLLDGTTFWVAMWPRTVHGKQVFELKFNPKPEHGEMNASLTLDARIRAYVAAMPPAISESGGHVATLKVAEKLTIGFALSIDQAWPYIAEYSERCEPPWSRKELEHKLEEAAKNLLNKPVGYLLDTPLPELPVRGQPSRPKPKELTETEKIEHWTYAIKTKLNGWVADPVNVWEASLIRLFDDYDGDARVAITCLHDPDDLININYDYRLKPDGRVDIIGPGITLSVAEWNEYLTEYPMPFREAGCWWRHNPVRSRQGSGKDGSFTDADIIRFRYHLFEIDKLPLELQLSFFCKMRVPVAMISDSGGKSYHALVKSFATTLVEFQDEAAYLLDEVFAKYGVDPKNKNPSRYSRLPGVPRTIGARVLEDGETDARQKILFLNPTPQKRTAIL